MKVFKVCLIINTGVSYERCSCAVVGKNESGAADQAITYAYDVSPAEDVRVDSVFRVKSGIVCHNFSVCK